MVDEYSNTMTLPPRLMVFRFLRMILYPARPVGAVTVDQMPVTYAASDANDDKFKVRLVLL